MKDFTWAGNTQEAVALNVVFCGGITWWFFFYERLVSVDFIFCVCVNVVTRFWTYRSVKHIILYGHKRTLSLLNKLEQTHQLITSL